MLEVPTCEISSVQPQGLGFRSEFELSCKRQSCRHAEVFMQDIEVVTELVYGLTTHTGGPHRARCLDIVLDDLSLGVLKLVCASKQSSARSRPNLSNL